MSSSTLQPGFRLAKYEVLAHIATGGMGAVYKATDLELGRTVALKVLTTPLVRREVILERFRREARYAARLNHPNVVTLYECGYAAEHDLHYLALEFIDGIDLDTHIKRKGQLPPDEARRILLQAAGGLDHAYEQGIVHRDIKPSNFLLARVGNKLVVKLTDLGLSRMEDDDAYKVTRDGATVGTIDYLSPEQARDSQAADVRSDIYSLGCTAYHMLAGKAPFAEGGLGERVLKHLEMQPPDVRQFNPAVSVGFWAILRKMLAKKPEDRYATPGELVDDLKCTAAEALDDEVEAPSEPIASSTPNWGCETPAEPIAAAPQEPRTPDSGRDRATSSTGITIEQLQAAAAFHKRAVQVLAAGGGSDYARELLTNCLKLDPYTPAYRQTLREVNRKSAGGTLGRWLGSFNVLALKSKMRAARTAGDCAKCWNKARRFWPVSRRTWKRILAWPRRRRSWNCWNWRCGCWSRPANCCRRTST